MARGQKVDFVISNLGSEEILKDLFDPMNVFMRVTYRVNQTLPTIKSDSTPVTFIARGGGIDISNVILEDVIPANAYIRSFEFTYTSGGPTFFHLNLSEDGGTNMIIFEEQGLLFIEQLKIVAGGS